MPKLNRQLRELLKDELVDDAVQARLVGAFAGHKVVNIAWHPRCRGQRPHTLLTPHGTLTIWAYFRGC